MSQASVDADCLKRERFSASLLMKPAGLVTVLLSLLSGVAVAASSVTRIDAYDFETATGLPSKHITEPADANLCSSAVYAYDAYGNQTSVTVSNCAGLAGYYPGSSSSTNTEAAAPSTGSSAIFASRLSTSSYTYSSDGTVTVVTTNAEQESETRIYGASFGELKSLTGPNGLKTQWVYDSLGRKTLESRTDGNGTQWTYLYCSGVNNGSATCPTSLNTGHATLQVTAYPAYVVIEQPVKVDINTLAVGATNGAYTKTYYDALNRPIRTEKQGFDVDANGAPLQQVIYQDTTYDNLGRVATTSRPYYSTDVAQVTKNQYDNWGRSISVTAADGSQSTTTYNGLVTVYQNGLSQTTNKTRNVVGQVEQVTDFNNKTLTLAYDAYGNLVQSTDSAGNVVKMQYDARGRKYAMQDPDMGSWTYAYNAVGDMVTQVDANAQTTTLQYDRVDRLLAKLEPNLNSNWYYSNYKGGGTCGLGVGKLCEMTSGNGYDHLYEYDSNGRMDAELTKVGKTSHVTGYDYTSDGRPLSVYYPSGLVTQNKYTPLGYSWQLMDSVTTPTTVYWKALVMDAEQHVKQQIYANNVTTTNGYDAATGRLKSTLADGVDGGNAVHVQNVSYSYDVLGNLKTRNDALTTVNATYGYDNLNRLQTEVLTGGALSGTQTITWTYDPSGIGNVQSRSDVGTYVYNPSGANSVRPHAVSSVTGTVDGLVNPSYTYDANGNLKTETATGGSRTVTWTSYNMVASVSQTVGANTNVLAFTYGPEHDRVQETFTKNGVLQRTTTYLNPGAGAGLLYEEEKNNLTSVLKQKHYLNAGGDTIGVLTYDGTNLTTQYWHKDQQGSTMVISDASGKAAGIERLAYEPFGKRRNANGTSDAAGTLTSANTERGYTEQEMMDEVGLINMNGRIYDPAISRFLSPDPTIQAPNYLQAYNRYSYTMNNPLKLFDPTGFSSTECTPSDPYGTGSEDSNTNYGGYGDNYAVGSSTSSWSTSNSFSSLNSGTFGGVNSLNNFQYSTLGLSDQADFFSSNQWTIQSISNGVLSDQDRCRGLRCTYLSAVSYSPARDNPFLRGFTQPFGDLYAYLTGNQFNPLTGEQPSKSYYSKANTVITVATSFIAVPVEDAILGVKSFANAAKEAGSIRGVNAIGGKMNCVNCAIATDATLAGRPASALGGGPFRIDALEKTFGGRFGAPGSIGSVSEALSAAGPGARGIVFGSRGSGEVGHVFNVVNQNGVVRFLDGQTGRAASLEGFQNFQLLRTN